MGRLSTNTQFNNKKAINENLNFSFSKESLKKYRKYGNIKFSMTQNPDTMDELGLFCALKEKTKIKHIVKASHLRGIESVHRMFPDFYKGCSNERIEEIQKEIKYIDIFLVALIYYIVGVWESIDHINFSKLNKNSKKELKRLLKQECIWLNNKEIEKLEKIGRMLYF